MVRTTYQNISRDYQSQIKNGIIQSGARIPSVREISKIHGVSIVTAQRAVTDLRRGGYIDARGRNGCFVINAWTDPVKSQSYRHEEISQGQRPLRIGLLASWEKENTDYVFPPHLAIERILTNRVFGSGGSVVHFNLREAQEQAPGVIGETLLNSGMDAFFIVNFFVSQEWAARLTTCLEKGGRICVSYCEGVAWDGVCDSIIVDDIWGINLKSLCFNNHLRKKHRKHHVKKVPPCFCAWLLCNNHG